MTPSPSIIRGSTGGSDGLSGESARRRGLRDMVLSHGWLPAGPAREVGSATRPARRPSDQPGLIPNYSAQSVERKLMNESHTGATDGATHSTTRRKTLQHKGFNM
jgi:hypothetical protein